MITAPHTYWAPGKLLLFGEHSAVFGYSAVGTALDRGLHLSVSPANSMNISLEHEASGVESETADALRRFSAFLSDRAPHLPPARLEIASDIPISGGFGSSAALCTALARWSLDMMPSGTDGDQAHREIWRRADELETFFHGTPSGIDTGLAALGGVQAFHFGREGKGALPMATPLSGALPPLVVGSVPRRRSTRELVAIVRRRHEENPTDTDAILTELGSLADAAIAHLSRSGSQVSATSLGEIASSAQRQLAKLGVSSPTLERMLHTGSMAGALGGKLSGAGDGGAFFLVCPNPEAAAEVHTAISRDLPPGGTVFVM